jgi:hypothetical protein
LRLGGADAWWGVQNQPHMPTQTKPLPIRYATTAAIPARYNFAQAMPNAIVPQYWLARANHANATHRIYRAASGAALRTVSL